MCTLKGLLLNVADASMEADKSAVELLKEPIFGNYTGQALVQMRNADQATWVQADLSDMIFTLGYGPLPIQAPVAKPGITSWKNGTNHFDKDALTEGLPVAKEDRHALSDHKTNKDFFLCACFACKIRTL